MYRQYTERLSEDRRRLRKLNTRQDSVWEQPSGAWGSVRLDHSYQTKKPRRECDIDTLFQIRAALILRMFLQKGDGISLQTIARLIVLTYLSADLATDRDGDVIVRHTAEKLTVPNVVQRLTRAGIK
jgi:hypothetical protein